MFIKILIRFCLFIYNKIFNFCVGLVGCFRNYVCMSEWLKLNCYFIRIILFLNIKGFYILCKYNVFFNIVGILFLKYNIRVVIMMIIRGWRLKGLIFLDVCKIEKKKEKKN